MALAAWAIAMVTLATPLSTQGPPASTIPCSPSGAELVNPPEIQAAGGILRGAIYLVTELQRLPTSEDGVATCRAEPVRVFRPAPPREPVDRDLSDPMPGPTLRARVGDLVQLRFINQIDASLFEQGLDIDACTSAHRVDGTYPEAFKDFYPNCLHASSTANIHFHGTHTNPDSTGDNVYLQIRPLPRNNQGELTTTAAQVTAGLDEFFQDCSRKLGSAPLKSWPVTWGDLPSSWTDQQTKLLQAYQQRRPTQPLWDENQTVLNAGGWPIYYIGAFPYCFALPEYPALAGKVAPVMGQSPGTHWYHAHKHGSTAINVMNGMTGVFIIEGKYDDDLNAAYGSYVLAGGSWNTRSQKILVLNQLGTLPNALTGKFVDSVGGVDFTVNGRLAPKVSMQPGEVQLWRIVNTSGRTAAFFLPPIGLEWRQIAQDGVQYDDDNYQASLNRPFYMAPANRVDLLVKAPMNIPTSAIEVRVQNVMAESNVDTNDAGRLLLTVQVAGPPVLREGQPTEMHLLPKLPCPPDFLRAITDDELKLAGSITRTLVFNSKDPGPPHQPMQHTINGIQFDDKGGHAHLGVVLGAVEEWKVVNTTTREIDHPLHIHINPFQISEMFDPKERIFDWNKKTAMPRYVFDHTKLMAEQCRIDPDDESTWTPCPCRDDLKDKSTWKPCLPTKKGHWWDVSRIPSAFEVPGKKVMIPGYFKMRSRFVDYPGRYVMHCHILIHEDRGMMYSVEVVRPAKTQPHH